MGGVLDQNILLILMVVLFIATIALFIYFFSLMKTIKQRKILAESEKNVGLKDDGEDDVKINITSQEIVDEKDRIVESLDLEHHEELDSLAHDDTGKVPVYVNYDNKLNQIDKVIDDKVDDKDSVNSTDNSSDDVKEPIIEDINDMPKITIPAVNEEVKVPKEKIIISLKDDSHNQPVITVPKTEEVKREPIVIRLNDDVKEKPTVVESTPKVETNDRLEDVINVAIKDKSYVFLANNNHLDKGQKIILSLNGKNYDGVVTRGNYQKDISELNVKPKNLVVEKII